MSETSIGERLHKLIKDLNITAKEFAQNTGIAYYTLSHFLNDRRGINMDTISKICKTYPGINPNWIITGKNEGIILTEEPETHLHPKLLKVLSETMPKLKSTKELNCMRYYDIEASASPVEIFNDNSKIEHQDLCVPGFNDCNIALNVWGDSMEPILSSGEIVMQKEWYESFIKYGHIYMIVTKNNHRMIKYIQPTQSEDSVSCESANGFYKPFPIERNDILKLYVVKGHTERNAIK
jgi:transcriptional regulator with XRE-family HTH domain